ncbi:rCG20192, partial [Rattus norvegicus]
MLLPSLSFLIFHGLKAAIWCKAGKDTGRSLCSLWPQACPPGPRETISSQSELSSHLRRL